MGRSTSSSSRGGRRRRRRRATGLVRMRISGRLPVGSYWIQMNHGGAKVPHSSMILGLRDFAPPLARLEPFYHF